MKEKYRSLSYASDLSPYEGTTFTHFLAAPPAFGLGLEAALTLVFPLSNPPVAGVLLGPPAAGFFGAPVLGVAVFFAAVPAALPTFFFAASPAVPVLGFCAAVPAVLAVPTVLGFFAGGNAGLLGVGLYALELFIP